MTARSEPLTALIVGTGLIGTSAALGLRRAGWATRIVDVDPQAQQQAVDLGAGQAAGSVLTDIDLVLVAVPPARTAHVVAQYLGSAPGAVVTDVASIKASILAAVEASGADASRYVGGHPLAGREVSGPSGARSDLFEGRPWVITVGTETSSGAVDLVRQVIKDLAALPVEMTATQHDDAVALVSHVPQVMASVTAAQLREADEASVALSGQGLRDVTRIAASDADLWTEILSGNAEAVLEVLDGISDDLDRMRSALREQRAGEVAELLGEGRAGRARIPGKHGRRAEQYTLVPVVIPDRPGALAGLFDAVEAEGVNIEDLALEHSPGQLAALVTLAVAHAVADPLTDGLRRRGWTVHR